MDLTGDVWSLSQSCDLGDAEYGRANPGPGKGVSGRPYVIQPAREPSHAAERRNGDVFKTLIGVRETPIWLIEHMLNGCSEMYERFSPVRKQ